MDDIRRRYIVTNSQTALVELLSLRDSGLAIARTEPPSFLLNWDVQTIVMVSDIN
jgi:hypothetical protein